MPRFCLVPCALALLLQPGTTFAQAEPDVSIELLEIDPGAAIVPPRTQVYGRIAYRTDTPVRLVLVPYRNGLEVETTNSGSPTYAAGSGETIAWFAFNLPQTIDEVRAVANDAHGHVFAEASLKRTLVWREGAARPTEAAWVDKLRQAPKDIVVEAQADSPLGTVAVLLLELVFALVPVSVVLQIYAWRKLEGNLKTLARISGYAMAALWLFVIVTGFAGSNLSPIWIVFLSPLFVVFLLALLMARSRLRRRESGILSPSG